MSRKLTVVLSAAFLMASSVAVSSAQAAGEDFCRDYARAAVRQVRGADMHRRCDWRVDNNPARWSTDWRAHFDWCRGVTREQADAERDARTRTLERCAHRD